MLLATASLLTVAALNTVAAEPEATAAEDSAAQATVTTGENDSFWSQFSDDEDGQLDLSEWLVENAYGFLPVPLIITEPAVDNGLGLAAVFFHPPDQDAPEREEGQALLPDVTAAVAAYTGNDSKIIGGGHFNTWRQDTRRYFGGIGYADINLDFFGSAGSSSQDIPPVPQGGAPFNAKGLFTVQSIRFRAGESDWFLGGEWMYLNSDVLVNTGIPDIDDTLSDADTVSGLAATVLYEKVNSNFSPTRGLTTNLVYRINDEAIGSDYDFHEIKWKIRQYLQLSEKFMLSWRLDGGSIVDGEAPFYLEPFIEMEGIPALRYQGPTAVSAELRGGYNFNFRWSVLAFAGGGRAADDFAGLSDASTRTAVGAGFRYYLARAFGLRVGLDVARGPEDTYVYLIIGNAWY